MSQAKSKRYRAKLKKTESKRAIFTAPLADQNALRNYRPRLILLSIGLLLTIFVTVSLLSRYSNGARKSWSPDGEKLIFSVGTQASDEARLVAVNLNNGGETEIKMNRSWYGIEKLIWKRSDELVMAAREDKQSNLQLWRVQLPNGEVSRVANDLNDYLSVSLSKAADKILTLQETNNFHLWLYDSETNAARQLTFGENRRDGVLAIGFAPKIKFFTRRAKKCGK
jgi:hypothetical protein